MEIPLLAAIVAFLVVVLLVFVYLSVRVVQQYEKMVVFRLGRTNEQLVREPGLRFLVPIIDRPYKVDLRETLTEVPSQTTITRDNAPINVDFLVYWRIVDPLRSVLAPQRLGDMLLGIASTTLRAVIGDILLDEVLSKREQINEVLRVKLDEVTERWGGNRCRPEDDGPPVSRGAQGARCEPGHEVRHPDGFHPTHRAVRRVRRARHEPQRSQRRRRRGGHLVTARTRR